VVDYKASTQGGKGTLSIFYANGDSKTLQSTHPTYTEVLTYLVANTDHDEDLVREMANPALRLGRALKEVDPRYDYDLYTLSYDGLPLSGPLADLIKDRLSNGKADWQRFARFAARLESNPSYAAKQALFQFIQQNGLHVLSDGRFLGHKAVNSDGLSIYSGPNNFINGSLYGKPGVSVRVPHAVGTVVSKRRGDVDDSNMACSTGLHVGRFSYANTFGGSNTVLLTVAVAPEDVVGGNYGEKFRTAAYEVVGVNENREEFIDGDFDLVDRSNVLSEGEKRFASNAALLSRDVEFENEEDRREYNMLSSAGRHLYLNLRSLLAKSHTLAFEAALAEHGTWEQFLAKQEAERAAQAEAEAQAAREAEVDAAAEVADEVSPPVQHGDAGTGHLATLATMDEKAEANAALKADLLTPTIGHKPLARKWEAAGVTESSVRRWRKGKVEVTTWTKVKDALS
jgi:hypothetical protein